VRSIDLSMPLWEGMPVTSTFPFNTHFRLEYSWTYEKNGYIMYGITLDTEGGTCFMQPSQHVKYKDGRKLDELPMEKLILRDTVVLTVPKKEMEAINVADIDKALDKADFREGDVVLLRTGWGDGEKYFKMGDDYVLKTPHYLKEAADRLAERLAKKKCDIFISDTALLGYPKKHLIPEWCSRKPRPENYPSKEAKKYLETYTSDKVKEDWGAFEAFPRNGITACKCAVNCGAIRRERVKLIILPLKLRGLPSSPCRIVAVEK